MTDMREVKQDGTNQGIDELLSRIPFEYTEDGNPFIRLRKFTDWIAQNKDIDPALLGVAFVAKINTFTQDNEDVFNQALNNFSAGNLDNFPIDEKYIHRAYDTLLRFTVSDDPEGNLILATFRNLGIRLISPARKINKILNASRRYR